MKPVATAQGERAAQGGGDDCTGSEGEGHAAMLPIGRPVTQLTCINARVDHVRNTRVTQLATEIFRETPTPLSLRELHTTVCEALPATAYSTIFRLAGRLEREGKISRVDWRERGSRFEWAERPHHHHIVCTDCGRAVDLDDGDLGFSERRIESRTGFRVKHHSIELEGSCSDCLE